MSGAAHTPGPWFAFDADYQREDHQLGPVFTVGPQEFHTVAQVRPGCDDDGLPAQTTANASLIAAAPEMLAALRALHLEAVWLARQLAHKGLRGRPGDGVDRALEGARAAIAKAEGLS